MTAARGSGRGPAYVTALKILAEKTARGQQLPMHISNSMHPSAQISALLVMVVSSLDTMARTTSGALQQDIGQLEQW